MLSRLITIIVCLFLTLILGFFLIWPKYQRYQFLQIEIKEKRTELDNREKYFSNLADLSEKLKKYETELLKINSAFPTYPSLPSLLNFLQKTSAQNGLIFKKIGTFSIVSPKKTEKTGGIPQEGTLSEVKTSEIKEIYIDFEVSGSHSAFKNFLSTLEKSARIIEIESISFSVEKEESPTFKLKIKTYSY